MKHFWLALLVVACVSDPRVDEGGLIPGRYIPDKIADLALFLGKDSAFIINEKIPCGGRTTEGRWRWEKPNLLLYDAWTYTIEICTPRNDSVKISDMKWEIEVRGKDFVTVDNFNIVTTWVNTP